MKTLSMMLMLSGLLLLLAGAALRLAQKSGIPFGRLPGDIHVEGRGWSVHFPIVTCIVISLLLMLLLDFFPRR